MNVDGPTGFDLEYLRLESLEMWLGCRDYIGLKNTGGLEYNEK